MPESANTQINSRIKLLVIISLVVVPFVMAWAAYFYGGDMIKGQQTNNGELILPPKDLTRLGEDVLQKLDGKWALLIPGGVYCSEDCQQSLYYTRQVNLALGKYADRVQRFYISGPEDLSDELSQLLSSQYPHLFVLHNNEEALRQLFGDGWGTEQRVYLVDPMGNIMMVYTIDLLGKPMLKDLKHLLKASNIG